LPGRYGGMAASGVISPVRTDLADRLVVWNLRQQFGQHRPIAHLAAGDLDGADLQGICINS
jgi:hypothetical protein